MATKRLNSFDLTKLFAIFLVIWGHCIQYFLSSNHLDEPVYCFIYSFHMPLFMMVSGFFAKNSFKKNIKDFISSKFTQLILPCLSWGVIYYIFMDILVPLFENDFRPNELFYNAYEILKNLFGFLKCLFVCFMIYFFCYKFIKHNVLCILISLLCSQILPYYYINVLFPFFLLGTFFNTSKGLNLMKNNTLGLISILVFVLLTFYIQLYDKKYVYWDYNCISTITAFTGCLSTLFLFNKVNEQSLIVQKIAKYGQHTLEIYILQTFVLESFLYNFIKLDNFPFFICNFIIIPILSVLILIICLILTKFLCQSEFFKYYFMGKNKQLLKIRS